MLSVMLVDDEEDALDLLEVLLNKVGDVTISGSYSDPILAMKAIEKQDVDLVFLDIEMPGIKGTQIARKIKTMTPQTMIVFTTAYSGYAVEAFEIQSDDYLLKPFSLERLQLTISRSRTSKRQSIQMEDTPTSIQCMGGFYLYLPHDEMGSLVWKTNKEKEVCAFLIHHRDKPVETDVIIEAIWPEYDLKKAKSYLYTCLSYLRRNLLENEFPAKIIKFGKGFTFSANGLKSDDEIFANLLQEILAKDHLDSGIYHQMNAFYKGEYMEGCGYQWAVSKQMRLKNMYILALRKFYEYFKSHNKLMAEESLQLVLNITPESEEDGRELIRLYMESGKRNQALNVYRQLEYVVHHHLGVELEKRTVKLYKQMNLHSHG